VRFIVTETTDAVALETMETQSWPTSALPVEDLEEAMSGFRLVEVKVFSATKRKDRDRLDEVATAWLRDHQDFDRLTARVTLSSDLEYHCLSITFMGWQRI
jgi:hypothetical protein